MPHALHSFQFRVHTPVFFTLFIAVVGTAVLWTDAKPPLITGGAASPLVIVQPRIPPVHAPPAPNSASLPHDTAEIFGSVPAPLLPIPVLLLLHFSPSENTPD